MMVANPSILYLLWYSVLVHGLLWLYCFLLVVYILFHTWQHSVVPWEVNVELFTNYFLLWL